MKWLSHKQTPQPYPKDYNHQTDHLPTQTLSTCIAFDSKLSSLTSCVLFILHVLQSFHQLLRAFLTRKLPAQLHYVTPARGFAISSREKERDRSYQICSIVARDGPRRRAFTLRALHRLFFGADKSVFCATGREKDRGISFGTLYSKYFCRWSHGRQWDDEDLELNNLKKENSCMTQWQGKKDLQTKCFFF